MRTCSPRNEAERKYMFILKMFILKIQAAKMLCACLFPLFFYSAFLFSFCNRNNVSKYTIGIALAEAFVESSATLNNFSAIYFTFSSASTNRQLINNRTFLPDFPRACLPHKSTSRRNSNALCLRSDLPARPFCAIKTFEEPKEFSDKFLLKTPYRP